MIQAPGTLRAGVTALVVMASAASLDAQSRVQGTIRDSAGAAVAAALVELSGNATARRTRAGGDGTYLITDVAPGSYTIRAFRLGYRPDSASFTVAAATVTRDLVLERAALPLSQVVVSPGRFGVGGEHIAATQTLTREDIETTPQLGEDIYRVVTRLPGVSSSDFSAKFRVRNGGNDEVLVLLDGLELYEPLHLKDFDGSLSIIDVAAVGGVDLLTGGFTAEYGDKTTGVFDITSSARAPAGARTAIGLSITNIRALSEGTFGKGRGQWLLGARRGYLDFVLKLIGEENPPDPTYYDVLGKVTWQLSPSHTLGARVLEANDNTFFKEDQGLVNSGYGNRYGWVTLDSRFAGGRIGARTMVSSAKLTWERDGSDSNTTGQPPVMVQSLSVADHRRMAVLGVKQDWSADVFEQVLLRFGADLKRFGTDYNYLAWQRRDSVDGLGRFFSYRDTTHVVAAPEGNEVGAYASARIRPTASFTLEAGARYDQQQWTDERAISPRLAAAYDILGGVTLRAAWGRYGQAQGIHEMQVLDGDSLFHPSEVAEHRVAGVEWSGWTGTQVRLELYDRLIASPRARWVNLDMDIEVFGEHGWDRAFIAPTSARARGIELFVQRNAGGRWSQSGSYVLAKATEEVNGVTRPRMYDQRHAAQLEMAYKPGEKWRFSAAWQFHSGWPISTPVFVEDTIRNSVGNPVGRRARRWNATINGERLPSYSRLDLRATRRFRIRDGELQLYADIFNALDRGNVRGYNYNAFYQNNQLVVQRFADTYLPRLPTIGMSWEF